MVVSLIFGGPVLKLKDGKELKGIDMRREGDFIMLEVGEGATIPVPADAVQEVGWVEDEKSGPSKPLEPANFVTGRTDAEQREADQRAATRAQERDKVLAEQRAETDRRAQQAEADRQEQRNQMNQNVGYGGGINLAGPPIRPPTAAEQLAVFGEPSKFAQDVVHFENNHPSYWIMDAEAAKGSPSKFSPVSDNAAWVPTDGFAQTGH